MILGIGTDIVEISRIAKAVSKVAFLRKCYTDAEIAKCNAADITAAENFAGYFAAKESVAKALGTGFRGFLPKDIEISHDKLGKPIANLSDNILKNTGISNDIKIHISISHGKDYAVAMAVIEG